MTASTAGGPARERLRFLNAVRGWALTLTGLNHTGRSWQDAVMLAPHAGRPPAPAVMAGALSR